MAVVYVYKMNETERKNKTVNFLYNFIIGFFSTKKINITNHKPFPYYYILYENDNNETYNNTNNNNNH